MARNEEVAAARARLDSEHAEVMEGLGDVWVAVEALRSSTPTDDLHELLKQVEKVVEKARDGGLFGSGANSHRRALDHWRELTEKP